MDVDRKRQNSRRAEGTIAHGVTLLELLAAIFILAAICWVAIPRLASGTPAAKAKACQTNVGNIHVQVELWYRDKDTWPAADLQDIGHDPARFPDGLPTCPVDGSRYTLDSVTHRVAGHEHSIP